MPSQKTLNEAYWQYTRQRENRAMENYAKEIQSILSKEDWAVDYGYSRRVLKRARRLQLLGSMILARRRNVVR